MIYVRFPPESGHPGGSQKRSAFDPKRTSVGVRRRYVCRFRDMVEEEGFGLNETPPMAENKHIAVIEIE